MESVNVKRMVIFTVVVAVLVFVITFVTQYMGLKPKKDTVALGTPEEQLLFPDKEVGLAKEAAPGSDPKKKGPPPLRRTLEWYTPGHETLAFENPRDEPVKVGLVEKKCTCTSVTLALAPTAWKDLPLKELPAKAEQARDLEWHELVKEDSAQGAEGKIFTVPARARGLVRLEWNNQGSPQPQSEPRPELYAAQLWTQAGGKDGQSITLKVGVVYLDAVLVQTAGAGESGNFTNEADVGEFKDKQQRTAEFICWSTTRTFKLSPKPAGPGLEVTRQQPMDAAELKKLEAHYQMPATCGYHVTVRVKAHELGPFRREVPLSSDPQLPASAYVKGIVRSDVRVISDESLPDAQDRIALGTFPAQRGVAEKTVQIRTEQTGLTMSVDGKPKFLEVVRLTPLEHVRDGQAWELVVKVPPYSVSGRFGDDKAGAEDCAVYLKIARPGEAGTKRIRIPVKGEATGGNR